MISQEMQIILGVVAVALAIAAAWALWRRTARQSLTVLVLTIGAIIVISGGVPVVWWQIAERLKGKVAQPITVSDHRITSQITKKIEDYLRLEAEIEMIAPKPSNERLEEIARSYLQERLGDLDLAAVRVNDGRSRPLLYFYVYKKSLDPEKLKPWLQPAPTEAPAHLNEPSYGELGAYRTVSIFVNSSTKWEALKELLGEARLPKAWRALDESLYDYLSVSEGESTRLVLIFALLDEEFLRQYQKAGGRPEELGLLSEVLYPPSLLIIVEALQEGLSNLGELAFVQGGRRYELRELSLRDDLILRQPWVRLDGNFPNFPNLQYQMSAGMRIIGLLRFPDGLDPYRAFQIYYGDRWVSFPRKT